MSRCVLVAVLVLTCGVARADDAEDKVVKLIVKLGGDVIRDEKKDGKPVKSVFLNLTEVTDADLKELAGFKNLSTLALLARR